VFGGREEGMGVLFHLSEIARSDLDYVSISSIMCSIV
jgi:hypothetical protein